MVYAAVIRPPAFGQVLESYDDIEAKSLPGVIDVITIGEKARELLNSGKANWTVQLSKSDKIVVIGKSTWDVIKGKKAIKATWKNSNHH